MSSRLIAVALAAVLAAPMTGWAVAESGPSGSAGAQAAGAASLHPREFEAAAVLIEVAPDAEGLMKALGEDPVLDSLQGSDGSADEPLRRRAAPTTYSFLAERRTVAPFAPLLIPSGPAGFPLRDQLDRHAEVSYSVVEDSMPPRLLVPVPAAAFMLSLTLCGLAVAGWWWQHRNCPGCR